MHQRDKQLSECKDEWCIARKLYLIQQRTSQHTPSSEHWRVPARELCGVVHVRNLIRDLADPRLLTHPRLSRSPRGPKTRCTRGRGRCLLFCCAKLFCIPPTYGLVSRCLPFAFRLPRGRLRWRNRGGRTFCFPQAREQSVNSENLKSRT